MSAIFGHVFYPHNLSRNKFKKEDRKMLQTIRKTAFVYGQKVRGVRLKNIIWVK